MNLTDELISLIRDEVGLDPNAEITGSTDLLLGGHVDSMGVLVLVGWLEEMLGIEIDPVDVVLENFQTVDQMVAYIDRRG